MTRTSGDAISIPVFNELCKCPKCGNDVPNETFCCKCGKQLQFTRSRRVRGNGQGTIIKTPAGKYKAVVTLGYWLDDQGKLHRKTRTKTFDKRKDAVSALVTLKQEKPKDESLPLRDAFDRWLPTHRAGESTLTCYRSAFRYFEDLYYTPLNEITVDDLQECLDNCDKGKRTKENMRAVIGLIYKYFVPRKMAEMNLAPYLRINAEASAHRNGFTADEIEKIRSAVGTVPNADTILCMIYTGFRPSEFLALTGKDYDPVNQTLTGGAKTAAGRNRIVTISPKIAHLIPCVDADEPLFSPLSLRTFTDKVFYPALERIGIDNPIEDDRHKYTPHSCRHTFATLMKCVPGADKDKLELIGHASSEMLRYYQDVGLDDLRKITNEI